MYDILHMSYQLLEIVSLFDEHCLYENFVVVAIEFQALSAEIIVATIR